MGDGTIEFLQQRQRRRVRTLSNGLGSLPPNGREFALVSHQSGQKLRLIRPMTEPGNRCCTRSDTLRGTDHVSQNSRDSRLIMRRDRVHQPSTIFVWHAVYQAPEKREALLSVGAP